ncbi:MAG: tetratricopeptide repeat protein [Phycisphaerae bacterium]|nr:tetratricopeptide repeat protein [Phycisphaerae bacterium]
MSALPSPDKPKVRDDAGGRSGAAFWTAASLSVACRLALVLLIAAAAAPVAAEEAAGGETAETLPPELDPTAGGKLAQAKAFLAQGEMVNALRAGASAARQAFREVSKTRKPSADFDSAIRFLLDMGKQAISKDELGIARDCYTQVRQLDKKMWEPVLGLAEVMRLSGQSWEAFQFYGDYLKMPNRPRDHYGELGMGLVCLALGQNDSARMYLERAVNLAPNDAEAKIGLARALHARYKYKEALAYAKKAVADDRNAPPDKRHPEYRYWLALMYKDAGQLGDAIREAKELSDSIRGDFAGRPDDVALVDKLDQVLTLRYELLEAQAKTDRGRRSVEVYLEMAEVIESQGALLQLRSYLRALSALTPALEFAGNDAGLRLEIGRLYRLVGNRNEAVKAYQSVLEVSPGNAKAKEVLREMKAPLEAPKATSTTAPATTSTTTSAATSAPKK